jgi:hypothetical protein
MITAHTMGITPTKALTAAREKFARQEHTIETELPQELSKLAETGGFSAVKSRPKVARSAGQGGGRKKTERLKKAAAAPKTRKEAVSTINGFAGDGHPTILADPRGWIQPR